MNKNERDYFRAAGGDPFAAYNSPGGVMGDMQRELLKKQQKSLEGQPLKTSSSNRPTRKQIKAAERAQRDERRRLALQKREAHALRRQAKAEKRQAKAAGQHTRMAHSIVPISTGASASYSAPSRTKSMSGPSGEDVGYVFKLFVVVMIIGAVVAVVKWAHAKMAAAIELMTGITSPHAATAFLIADIVLPALVGMLIYWRLGRSGDELKTTDPALIGLIVATVLAWGATLMAFTL